MHRSCSAVLLTVLLFAAIPCCDADPAVLTIGAFPDTVRIGERVILQGNTSTPHIIAVYLFLTGPNLDRRGVTLENINLPAGQGYFTSAHVNPDGSWLYEWDTAFIAGRLEPGTYTVHVENIPLNLFRNSSRAIASANITVMEPVLTPNLASGWGVYAVAGLVLAGILALKRS